MTPGRMDGIAVDHAAVGEAGVTVESRLLPQLAACRLQRRLTIPQAAGDGLPEALRFAAQELQDLAIIRVDDDQD